MNTGKALQPQQTPHDLGKVTPYPSPMQQAAHLTTSILQKSAICHNIMDKNLQNHAVCRNSLVDLVDMILTGNNQTLLICFCF